MDGESYADQSHEVNDMEDTEGLNALVRSSRKSCSSKKNLSWVVGMNYKIVNGDPLGIAQVDFGKLENTKFMIYD